VDDAERRSSESLFGFRQVTCAALVLTDSFYIKIFRILVSLDDEKLQSLAESYVRVTTVFLALQVAGVTFLLTELNGDRSIFVFATLGIPPMVSALAMFLGARDPRLWGFPRGRALDAGVALTAASLFVTALGAGYGAFILSQDGLLGFVVSVSLIGPLLVFYPFSYYHYTRRVSS
jgi:hypothetical protein